MKLKLPSGEECGHPVINSKAKASKRARVQGQDGGERRGIAQGQHYVALSSLPKRTWSFELISLGSSFNNDLARPI